MGHIGDGAIWCTDFDNSGVKYQINGYDLAYITFTKTNPPSESDYTQSIHFDSSSSIDGTFTTASTSQGVVNVECGFRPSYIRVILPFANGDTYATFDSNTSTTTSTWYIPMESRTYTITLGSSSGETGIVDITDTGFKFRSNAANTLNVLCSFHAMPESAGHMTLRHYNAYGYWREPESVPATDFESGFNNARSYPIAPPTGEWESGAPEYYEGKEAWITSKNEAMSEAGYLPSATRVITSAIPIFWADDTESIRKYVESGDIDGAINADQLSSRMYANWTFATTESHNPTYSLACDVPAFNDPSSDYYGQGSIAQISLIYLYNVQGTLVPIGSTAYSYGSTWQDSLTHIIESSELPEAAEIAAKILDVLDLSDLQLQFLVSTPTGSAAQGYVRVDHSTIDDYGFLNETHGDTINIERGLVLSDSDSDTSNDGYELDDGDSFSESDTGAPSVAGTGLLTTTYALTPQEARGVGSFLWGAGFLDNIKLINNNPIENIVGCKLFPLTISGTESTVQIGNVPTSTTALHVSNNVLVFKDCPELTVPTAYSDNLSYLDYAPYTRLELYMPFVGVKELPTDICMGKAIKLEWAVDLITGTLESRLLVSGRILYTYNSNIGVDIPLTAQNRAQVEAAYIQNAIGGGLSAASGNLGGVASAAANMAFTQYHSQTTGTPSSATAMTGVMMPFLNIIRPEVKNIGSTRSTYKELIGAPCNQAYTLGNLKGYTEVLNASVQVDGATKAEVDELNRLLESGVIL